MKKLLTYSFVVFFGFSLFSACTKHDGLPPIPQKTFVLVHGAWQAPWVWDQVKLSLEKAGQRVAVVTLSWDRSEFFYSPTPTLGSYRGVGAQFIFFCSCRGCN